MSAFLSVPISSIYASSGNIASGIFSMGLIQDIILIVISGLACLYCVILNRRVKALSNMKSGLGASIVSLTDAIRQTQNAAKDTEVTTLTAMHNLQNLMDEAESTISKLEARKIDLDRQVTRASKLADLQSQLVQRIEVDLPKAITSADKILIGLKSGVSVAHAIETESVLAAPTQKSVSDKPSSPPMTPATNTTPEKGVRKTASTKRAKTSKTTVKSATQAKLQGKAEGKKVTPMKKSKSRDIVNLSNSEAASGSASNKKIAS